MLNIQDNSNESEENLTLTTGEKLHILVDAVQDGYVVGYVVADKDNSDEMVKISLLWVENTPIKSVKVEGAHGMTDQTLYTGFIRTIEKSDGSVNSSTMNELTLGEMFGIIEELPDEMFDVMVGALTGEITEDFHCVCGLCHEDHDEEDVADDVNLDDDVPEEIIGLIKAVHGAIKHQFETSNESQQNSDKNANMGLADVLKAFSSKQREQGGSGLDEQALKNAMDMSAALVPDLKQAISAVLALQPGQDNTDKQE